MSSKIILFGNSGFIGSYIQNNLKNYKVYGYSSKDCNLLNIKEIYKVFDSFIEPVNIIITSSIVRTKENSFESFDKNIMMIKNLSIAIRDTNIKIKHVLFLSTIDVYGQNIVNIINEQTLTNPMDFYALSKLTSEFLLKNICLEKNISLSILRLPGVYGENETNSTLCTLIKSAQEGLITIYGDGSDKRDFLYIKDLLKVMDTCIKEKISDTINVASGKSFSINEIAQELIKKFNNSRILYKLSKNEKRQTNLEFNNIKLIKYLVNYQITSVIDYLKGNTHV